MIPETTRVVRIHEFGDASGLRIESLPVPAPAADQVMIEVHALGLNRAEIMLRDDVYMEHPELPSRIGYEASGIVISVGDNVESVRIGDRVATVPGFSMAQFGVYAEHAVVPASVVARIPDNFTYEQGASIWMQYITAYGGLIDIGQLKGGDTVVITAAASSVGIAAIQLARLAGATVVATTRNNDKADTLREFGADVVVNTSEASLADVVMTATNGHGADLIFDAIGGAMLAEAAAAAAPRGTIVLYGALDSRPTELPLINALAKGLTVRGYTLFEISTDPARLARVIAYLNEVFTADAIRPLMDERRFLLDDIVDAQRYMESNEHIGKIVVNVAHGGHA